MKEEAGIPPLYRVLTISPTWYQVVTDAADGKVRVRAAVGTKDRADFLCNTFNSK